MEQKDLKVHKVIQERLVILDTLEKPDQLVILEKLDQLVILDILV